MRPHAKTAWPVAILRLGSASTGHTGGGGVRSTWPAYNSTPVDGVAETIVSSSPEMSTIVDIRPAAPNSTCNAVTHAAVTAGERPGAPQM